MDSTENLDQQTLRSKRRTILIMLAVFALPYAMAWFLYFKPEVFNLGTRNHGTLISPVISQETYQLSHPDGTSYQFIKDSDKWMLMTFGSATCEKACQTNLFTLQQLRRMMGVDRIRLNRSYILLGEESSGAIDQPSINQQLEKFQGTSLYRLKTATAKALEEKLGIPIGKLKDHILVADPRGNLVMYYPQEEDPKKIIEDIEILFGKIRGA